MFRSLAVIVMCAIVLWLTWTASQQPQEPREGIRQDAERFVSPITERVERWQNR